MIEKIVGEEFVEHIEIPPPCTSSVLRRTTAFASSLGLSMVMTSSIRLRFLFGHQPFEFGSQVFARHLKATLAAFRIDCIVA